MTARPGGREEPARRPRRRWLRGLAIGYLVLLAASHVTRALAPALPQVDPAGIVVPRLSATARVTTGGGADGVAGGTARPTVTIALRDLGPEIAPAPGAAPRPPLLLLHGSPGRGAHFAALETPLSRSHRVLVPDLVGFGGSSRDVGDISLPAQAAYLRELLDALGVGPVHVVGFSLGGGVALDLWDQAPDRIASITLLSSIGVQEMELLGDYHLNHALHRLQSGVVWLAFEAVPHFGALDGLDDLRSHAAIFEQSDQRPLRGLLTHYDRPMLVIHGETDFLVPPSAAREHARLVPQAELQLIDQGHFMVFNRGEDLAGRIDDFVARVDAGRAPLRAGADPARIAAAARPFDPADVPPAHGPLLWLLTLLLALSTLLSEDLTCIAAGLLVAAGRIAFLPATAACVAGIFGGDVLLFLAGRCVGRAALARPPLRWFLRPATVRRGEAWFRRRGLSIVFVCRFLPGLRLPTYFAAGVLGTSLPAFAGCFLVAALAWTPMLVGLAAATGVGVETVLPALTEWGPLAALTLFLALVAVVKLGVPALSHRGRRQLLGRWRRITHWEFWPPWLVYPPIVAWIAWLALRHRSLTVVTAVNPAIPLGGFVGESKGDILAALAAVAPDAVAATARLAPDDDTAARVVHATGLAAEVGGFPVVVKPDVGQRGRGVSIVRDAEQLARAVAAEAGELLVQAFVPGVELGVFWVRHPGWPAGRIISVTDKRLPEVVGDGVRTLEELVLDDARAPAMAEAYFEGLAERLADVPPRGERVGLVEVATHCRGAIFLDGRDLLTPPLQAAVERLGAGMPGFHFGRFDLRAPDTDALRAGRGLLVIELNGLTSEAAHVYDPRHSVWEGWRTLAGQWRLAFEIGAANRAAGARPATLGELIGAAWRFLRPRREDAAPVLG